MNKRNRVTNGEISQDVLGVYLSAEFRVRAVNMGVEQGRSNRYSPYYKG